VAGDTAGGVAGGVARRRWLNGGFTLVDKRRA
jgi:hypothetical protein